MEARHKLAKWLKMQGLSQSKAAKELGSSQAAMSKWIAGSVTPRLAMMVRIEKWSQGFVRVTDWVPAELPRAGAEYSQAKAA